MRDRSSYLLLMSHERAESMAFARSARGGLRTNLGVRDPARARYLNEESEMITSYLAGEMLRQRADEARERADRSRLAAVATKAARERKRAAKAAKPSPKDKPAGNAEQGAVMSC